MAKKKGTLKYVIIGVVCLLILVILANKLGWIGQGDVEKVSTEQVSKRTVNEQVSASGKVQPEVEVKLSSEVSGEIVELTIKEGDIVKKGDVLCRVKPDILQSGYDRAVASLNAQKATLAAAEEQLKQTEATFANIEATYKRNQELFSKKVISAAEFDQIQSDYRAAIANIAAQKQNVEATRYGIDQSQAMVKEAADNLARTTIYAPVDGVISLLSVELGERVVGTAQMAGTEIMRIANMTSMEVNVEVNENDINRVSVGNEASIEVDAFRDRVFKGVVTEIASSAMGIETAVAGASSTEQVTNFLVKVRILQESYEDILKDEKENTSPFKPGLSATVDIHTQKDKGLSVPIQSVTTREVDTSSKTDSTKSTSIDSTEKPKVAQNSGGAKAGGEVQECVFVYDPSGKVTLRVVKTGIQDDQYIRILEGLAEGDEVVTGPFNAISKTLKDGAKVEKVAKGQLFDQ